MDASALYKFSSGLYVVSADDGERPGACIVSKRYLAGGGLTGAVALIGSTRMEYRRLLEQLRGGGDFYDNYTTTYTTGVSPGNLCMTMCALNFCLGPLCGWRFICC